MVLITWALFIMVSAGILGLYSISKGKYVEDVEFLPRKDFPFKRLMPLSLYILEKVRYKYNTGYDKDILRKYSQIEGTRLAPLYLRLHWANKIALVLTGLLMILFIGSITMLLVKNTGKNTAIVEGAKILRPVYGEGNKDVRLEAVIKKGTAEVVEQFEIPLEELPPASEDEKKLAQTSEELTEEAILGGNEALDRVTQTLILPENDRDLGNNGVSIKWESQKPQVISPGGQVKRPSYGEDKQTLYIRAILTKGSTMPVKKVFRITVLPKTSVETDEQAVAAARGELSRIFKAKGEGLKTQDRKLQLPTSLEKLGGVEIKWQNIKDKADNPGISFIVSGIIILGAVAFAQDSSLNRKIKRRRLLIQIDFPDFLNRLTLLLNAGLTVGRAWERIAAGSKNGRPLYEELALTLADIKSGKAETYAYEDFAKRCGIPEVTRFVSVIVHNMKKGSTELAGVLKFQAGELWEMRKNAAKRLGEEASVKMLFPMMIMFAAILIIVALPAIMAMKTY